MTDEVTVTARDWVRGSARSKTMWLGTTLFVLSTVAQYQTAWEPLLGAWGPLLGQGLGVAISALRLVTNKPIPHK